MISKVVNVDHKRLTSVKHNDPPIKQTQICGSVFFCKKNPLSFMANSGLLNLMRLNFLYTANLAIRKSHLNPVGVETRLG